MKRISLGIPLSITMLGTIGTLLFRSKSLHIVFGSLLVMTSGIHFYQHNKKIKKDMEKGLAKMNILRAVGLPSSKLEWFLQSIQVKSYIPGRIRVYSKLLINNNSNKKAVLEALGKFKELDSVKVNIITGSVLIEYNPDNIKKNTQLVEIEAFIKNKVNKK